MHEPIKFIIGMEGMMLSEIARERQVLYVITYMGNLKNKTAQNNKLGFLVFFMQWHVYLKHTHYGEQCRDSLKNCK